jgi:hypothetical protein
VHGKHEAQAAGGARQRVTGVKRRKLDLKAALESRISHLSFNTLRSRRFQLGFDRVNLHRPTGGDVRVHLARGVAAQVEIEIKV